MSASAAALGFGEGRFPSFSLLYSLLPCPWPKTRWRLSICQPRCPGRTDALPTGSMKQLCRAERSKTQIQQVPACRAGQRLVDSRNLHAAGPPERAVCAVQQREHQGAMQEQAGTPEPCCWSLSGQVTLSTGKGEETATPASDSMQRVPTPCRSRLHVSLQQTVGHKQEAG